MFPLIRTKYGEIRNISPYSVRMRIENTEQKNSKYRHFSRCVTDQVIPKEAHFLVLT